MYNEKIQKTEFGMIKWDLYRLKCEEIEEQYADFKRAQRKIRELLTRITLNTILKTLKNNYYKNHEIV